MENISKIAIDDSCTSMYFSFNSTTANKTVEIMESCAEISCIVSGDEDAEQNMTLEAEEEKPDDGEHIQTVKKLPLSASPAKAIPKYMLSAYKALSSTPTKAQLLRSVEVTRGSAAAVGISDLGLAFLEAPQDSINSVLLEDKENQPQESQEIYSESSSENIVSVIEKTQEEQKPLGKRVGFSNLPVLKGSGNTNIRGTPKITRPMQKCEPDLISNRPSRITSKRMSIFTNGTSDPAKEFTADELPKMINSILKISKEMSLPTKRKSFANPEKPFNLLGKATRMSIVKTTLNSPARKISRKSIASVQLGRNPMRQSMVPMNKRKSIAPVTSAVAAPRRSVMPTNTRKSMLPTTITSPKKRIIPMNSRKSVIPEKPTSSGSMIPSRKTMAPKPSTSIGIPPTSAKTNTTKAMKPPSGLKKEHVCEVCFRKFLVLSLFEAHRRTHSTAATSAKQTFLENDKQCRYCDKKFAIAKALSNHLIQNCTKIPPGDKKKLLFPSLAQPQQVASTRMPSKSKSVSSFSSHDSLASNSTQHSQFEAKLSSETSDASMPPPQNKIKKKLAHSGVYCTPNKLIPCHVCKISFSNILDYTDHSLSHSTDEAAVSTSTESTTQTHNADVKSDATQTLQEDGVVPLN